MSEYIPLWQSFNYIGLTGAMAVLCGLSVLYYLNYRRVFGAIVAAIYCGISTAAYLLLSAATGLHPLLDLDAIRPWVQVCRSLQLLTLMWLIFITSNMVRGKE